MHLLRTCSLRTIWCNLHHANHLYLFAILVCYLPHNSSVYDVTAVHFRLSMAIQHVREMCYLLVELSLPNDKQLIYIALSVIVFNIYGGAQTNLNYNGQRTSPRQHTFPGPSSPPIAGKFVIHYKSPNHRELHNVTTSISHTHFCMKQIRIFLANIR